MPKTKKRGWQSRGTVTVALSGEQLAPKKVDRTEDERRASSWEAVRAYVPERVDGPRVKEAHDTRMKRLASKRARCPVCKAITGERCYDLFASPTKVYTRGFHAKRKLLKPKPKTVERMTALPKRNAECAGGNCHHTSFDHKQRTGKCAKCRCRSFKG